MEISPSVRAYRTMNKTSGSIFQLLKTARQNRGLTQSELGKLLGLPQSHISEIEQGRHDVKLSTLRDWSRILDFELVLVPRKHLPAVSFLINQSDSAEQSAETPSAYGPLPDPNDRPEDQDAL
jgi:transcriptional regulator with XRE-family HTH domain